MYRFEHEEPGILAVTIWGFWTDGDADAYLAEMRDRTMALRRSQGYALVLVDGRETAVQSATVMGKVAGIEEILIRDERDRAACVVANSLSKMQAQRLSRTEQLRVFLSPSAARTWLLAYHKDD